MTKDEIRRVLEERGIYASDKDVSGLVDKYDKDRDGKISYNEFMDEILPKSPGKAFWFSYELFIKIILIF